MDGNTRARICAAAASSISTAMSPSSSRGAGAARGWRPRRRGYCDGPPPRGGRGAASGFRPFNGEPGDVAGPFMDPGFQSAPPCPGFYLPPPPPYGWSPVPRGPWSPQPWGSGLHPRIYGPNSPRQNWQASPPPGGRPPPPPDYRRWLPSSSPPSPECERFRVVSYNILADYLARDHWSTLYSHIRPELIHWEWRKRRLLIEFGLWSPDIMCLQEVDKFQDLEQELFNIGYSGIWKIRTGTAVDGCAIFWRADRFSLKHEEHIEFAKLGLRDNVAQICVLESRSQNPADKNSAASSVRLSGSFKTDQVVVCNIHVLYNPKRGDIKLGQVRVLLDRAYSVSRNWNDAPVIICGDFNCVPKSPLYNFISGQKLNLSGLARNWVSGQYSACVYPRKESSGTGLYRTQSSHGKDDGNAYVVELDSHKTSINNSSNTPNNAGSACSAEQFTYVQFPEKVCINGQFENEKGKQCDIVAGFEVVGFSNSAMHIAEDLSKNTVEDVCEPAESVSYKGSEGLEKPTSGATSSQGELVNRQRSVIPGSNGMSPGTSCSPGEVNTSSSSGENSIALQSCEYGFSSCKRMITGDGDEGFTPAKDSECSPCCRSESEKSEPTDSSFSESSSKLEMVYSSVSHESWAGAVEDVASQTCGVVGDVDMGRGGGETSSPLEDQEINNNSFFPEEFTGEVNNNSPFLEELHGGESTCELSSTSFDDSFLGADDQNLRSTAHVNVYDPLSWTPAEVEAATGDAGCTCLEHNLRLRSAYTEVEDRAGTRDYSGEPRVTSYNRQFMGTVDYIWHSEGLQTVRVLDTIPAGVLQRTPGFPTKKWGSDHLALACEFAFQEEV